MARKFARLGVYGLTCSEGGGGPHGAVGSASSTILESWGR